MLSGQLPSTTSPSVVHEQNVPDPDLLEVHAERVDPEVVVELGVAGGDVPGRTLVEAEVPEQAEGGGEPLLAVPPLLFDAAELRERVRCAVGRHCGQPTTLYRSVHRIG